MTCFRPRIWKPGSVVADDDADADDDAGGSSAPAEEDKGSTCVLRALSPGFLRAVGFLYSIFRPGPAIWSAFPLAMVEAFWFSSPSAALSCSSSSLPITRRCRDASSVAVSRLLGTVSRELKAAFCCTRAASLASLSVVLTPFRMLKVKSSTSSR